MAHNSSDLTPRDADIENARNLIHQNFFIDKEKFSEFEALIESPLESTEKLERLAGRPSVFSD